eukprot:TRINITY_DN38510_c0_g1_i1.p1 TRINITY_DN38510_c0_g1~~TRINITY_DN38510_c0_g1_i1.p1  ORF type:complete len:193 (+),score=37.12 TRINITY_DN38510_c0_g1_i1:64-642(+)
MEAICQACSDGDVESVTRLAVGTDVNAQRSPAGYLPLHYAAMARQHGADSVAALVSAGGHLNATTNEGKQAVHLAAENQSDVGPLEALLAARSDPNAKTVALRSPLHFAAVEGAVENARILLAARANVNAENSCGAIPLHWAAKTGKMELCDLLVEARSDLTVMDNLGRTPAEMAADNRQCQIAEALMSSKI